MRGEATIMSDTGGRAVEPQAVLQVESLTKSYQPDGSSPVLHGVDFEVQARELVSVVGPSGAGKTTLLNCITGILRPTSGDVRFAGGTVDGPPDRLAMVFQDYGRSLLPWLDVMGNVTLPLRRVVRDKARRAERALHVLESVGLNGAERKKPYQLSGGMQQRVAIARALAYQPILLVMDEPFASVDAQTREELEDLTLKLRKEYDMTIVLVTHDIDEAVYLSDRIIILAGSPTTVRGNLDVRLGRDRDQITTKALSEFNELRAIVHAGVRGQELHP